MPSTLFRAFSGALCGRPAAQALEEIEFFHSVPAPGVVIGAYGHNWNHANWKNGYNAATSSSASLKSGGDDVNGATSYILGFSATDRLKFEAGAGYRNHPIRVNPSLKNINA